MRMVLAFAALLLAPHAGALELRPVPVAPAVYAVIGDLGAQTYDNDGLNANLGFVVGAHGVLVINTGPTTQVARAFHAAIGKVTDRPVKWVINTNSQNHYWHGNTYFHDLGARIYAQREAARVMGETGLQQLEGNRRTLRDKVAGTTLTFPERLVGTRDTLDLGDIKVELHHFGPAHTPGDLAVWLPQSRVLFSGDIIYTERMLAVLPIGSSRNWLKAFDSVVALQPKVIVPGHGAPTDTARATRETRDYLVYLREQARKSIDRGDHLDDAINRIDQSRFRHLANFNELARRNAHTVYLEVEME